MIKAAIFWLWSLLYWSALVLGAESASSALIEAAKKEAKMVFYTSVETEFARSLTSAFEVKYPFIKTDIFRSTHDKIFSRMNIERQTSTFTADVVSVGEF